MTLNDAMVELARVLRAENDALAAGDLAGAGRLLAGKAAAAAALQDARGRWAQGAGPDAGLLGALRSAAEENRSRLVLAMEVQARITKMVARAARAASVSHVRYGASGGVRPSVVTVALALRA